MQRGECRLLIVNKCCQTSARLVIKRYRYRFRMKMFCETSGMKLGNYYWNFMSNKKVGGKDSVTMYNYFDTYQHTLLKFCSSLSSHSTVFIENNYKTVILRYSDRIIDPFMIKIQLNYRYIIVKENGQLIGQNASNF